MELINCISRKQTPDFEGLCGPLRRRQLEALAYMVDPSKITIPIFVLSNLTEQYMNYMLMLIEYFGEQMPHMNLLLVLKCGEEVSKPLIFIPCGLFADKVAVFQEMKANGIVPPNTHNAWLYKLWLRHFPHVRIRQTIPFAKCQVCTVLFRRFCLQWR
jgi:hypothetical protein